MTRPLKAALRSARRTADSCTRPSSCTGTTRPSRSTTRRARLVASGVLTGLAVGATVVVLASRSSHPVSSSHPADAPVSAGAASAPSPLAVAPRSHPQRASRGLRVALPPKRTAPTPMKVVTQTVASGSTFSGQASWYGGFFQGRTTANGERFDTNDLTAASKTLPFGTRLRVCRLASCVVVRVNDRGPYVGGRVLDLSRAAAQQLGYSGVAHVTATPVQSQRVAVPDLDAARVIAAREHRAAVVRRAQATRRAAARRAEPRTAEQAAVQAAVLAADERDVLPGVPVFLAATGLGLASCGGVLAVGRRRTRVTPALA